MILLLAIDIGNTNITAGLFGKTGMKRHWRLETKKARRFFRSGKICFRGVSGVIVSSVVPSLNRNFNEWSREYLGQKPLWVTPATAKIPLRIDRPGEVGADRLCNAVAVWEKWRKATIIVDFGTATTLDIVTAKGEYGGGAILPGLQVAAWSLSVSTARLPKVKIVKPKRVVGRNTVECIRAGLYYGYAGMVDRLIALSRKEEGVPMKVVATGGLAPLIARESKLIEEVAPHLTLEGLYHIWQKNLAHDV